MSRAVAIALALAAVPRLALAEPAAGGAEDAHERWLTYEASAGPAVLTGLGHSEVLQGAEGINGGVGLFVTPRLAASLRLAGLTDFKSGVLYVGMVGAHLQFWFGPRVWTGAGIGYGFFGGCASSGCSGGHLTTSYDGRIGVTLTDTPCGGLHLAAEIVAMPLGSSSATAIGLVLGYQAF